ncbi:MAG: tRNA lysidine(34) synthetase TilS [Hyphomonadaceae bacterium]|nr:tRNA lysidine(34) synthetase TilS [Hyphomonadaceae bacterium]
MWSGSVPGPLGVAVSGGGDSIALLHIASAWAHLRGRDLHVLTVDHGLRVEARSETDFVAGLARELGHDCTQLTLNGLRPVQAETRLARQRILAAACARQGITTLLTGHTRDDQLETFLMRARQGSGWYGLGGVDLAAPSPAWPEGRGLSLVRPLLGCTRSDLRTGLRKAGQDWCEDPSNQDRAYERVRMRNLLAGDDALRERVRTLQTSFSVLRRAEQCGLAKEMGARLHAFADGSLLCDLTNLRPSRAERLLSLAVQFAAGHARMPRRSQLRPVLDALGQEGARFTCAGAWLQLEGAGQVRLARDPGLVQPGWVDGVWDGRFERAEAKTEREIHPMSARSLPETGADWRALAPGRLAQIRSIWRQMSLLSHRDAAEGVVF